MEHGPSYEGINVGTQGVSTVVLIETVSLQKPKQHTIPLSFTQNRSYISFLVKTGFSEWRNSTGALSRGNYGK